MKRVILTAGAAALVSVVALAAQESKPTTTGSKDTMTVTGCLQAGTTADTFTLSNVTETAKASTTAGTTGAGTSSATASASSSAAAGGKGTDTKYELTPDAGVNLKPHVGHRVEITGTPDMKGAAGTTGSTTSASASASGPGATKKMKVTAVKHIAASCS